MLSFRTSDHRPQVLPPERQRTLREVSGGGAPHIAPHLKEGLCVIMHSEEGTGAPALWEANLPPASAMRSHLSG